MEPTKRESSLGMEDNLKKAVTEMLILSLLSQEDMFAAQIMQSMEEASEGQLSIVFPYAALYRLESKECIEETRKRIAPDGRRRQYYHITDKGLQYLAEQKALYRRFTAAVEVLLRKGEADHDG